MGLFRRKSKRRNSKKGVDENFILSENSPFSIKEAYKTLRTNLIFSLAEEGCKKILITSTTMNECKSTTAINICITLAQNNSKVLLIDCDMRLSHIAKSLHLAPTPGLSDYLVGVAEEKTIVQPFIDNLDVITAGTIPPNPSELLGAVKMDQLVHKMEKNYDFIVYDTPPAGILSDPVILSRLATGFAMVVRREVAHKDMVDKCMRDMSITGIRNLGFIFTVADNMDNKYYYKSKKS